MRGASPAGTRHPYTSLMARLAALPKNGDGVDAPGSDAKQAATAFRRRLMTTYFGYGLFASIVFGCTAMLPLLFAHPGAPRNQGVLAVASNTNVASVPLWPAHGGIAPEAEINSFELPIRRSERASAAFPLQITGTRPADIKSVVLHDLPEQAWLSKGERQDEHTWVVRASDLSGLRLSMGEGTPDAFDLTIEVATASGDPAGLSVARVRLLDAPAQLETPVATTDEPVPMLDALPVLRHAPVLAKERPAETAPQQKTTQKPLMVQAPRRVQVTEEVRPAPHVTRPEGMSALGMSARETSPDERQLWWKMPSSPWAGVADLPNSN
jgi:hypothetical protein